MVGTSLTGFALAVWVFQKTGSVTQLALISVAAVLPGMLLSPFVGPWIDRWDRRLAMLGADLLAGISTLVMAGLLWAQALQTWHIYASVAVASLCTAVQMPAWTAATSLLVPAKALGRASGMVQLGGAAAMLVGPATAGAMMGSLGVEGIIAIDVATFLTAVLVLLVVRFPAPTGQDPQDDKAPSPAQSLRASARAWEHIKARPGLLGLLGFALISNLCLGMVHVLITPLVLSFADPATLGTVMSTAGVGMLVGSVVMIAWGGPRNKAVGVAVFSMAQGALLLLGGLQPSAWLVGAGAFGALVAYPIVNACNQTIWQMKIPPEMQGRVFALRNAIASSTLPLAYLLAGPLADGVFEPLLAHDGPLAGSLGQVLGTGPGRGIGLLFMALGCLAIGASVAALAWRPLRQIETDLPDALPPS